LGILSESDHLVDPVFDERIILMSVFRKWKGWNGCFEVVLAAGIFECSNET